MDMNTIIINRYQEEDKQTIGELILKNRDNEEPFTCHTLELPWRANAKNTSRIPEGEYLAVKHVSPKFGACLWIQEVPNRTEILIHRGNFHKDTLGCILVGKNLTDIDGDGYRDVTHSRDTLKKLLEEIDRDIVTVHINDVFF